MSLMSGRKQVMYCPLSGLGEDVPDDGHAGPCLSVGVGATLDHRADEVDLVVVVEAMVGAELDGQVIRDRRSSGRIQPSVSGPRGWNGATGKGRSSDRVPPADEDLEAPNAPKLLSGATSMLYAASAAEPAEGASTKEGREVGAEPGHKGIVGRGVGGDWGGRGP